MYVFCMYYVLLYVILFIMYVLCMYLTIGTIASGITPTQKIHMHEKKLKDEKFSRIFVIYSAYIMCYIIYYVLLCICVLCIYYVLYYLLCIIEITESLKEE